MGLTLLLRPEIILVIIALIVLALILIKEKKLRKSISLTNKKENKQYKRKLKLILSSKDSNKLEKINSLARKFFKEAFDLGYNLEYSELEEKFGKIDKNAEEFCKKIISLNYSGKSVQKKELLSLGELLTKVFNDNKLP